ncbi:MAG: hypothetical protein M3169_17620, partial [Candidatus Eremiobacteraeota bacterium]|nr:hypothetical protein [Candidatus Eremiobacteraeota bacterium]
MRFAARPLALAALLGMVGAAPPPDALATIAAATGHPAELHFHAEGKRTIEGRSIETSFDVAGTTHVLRRCIAGVCGGSWFDGARRWTFGLNEVVLPEE